MPEARQRGDPGRAEEAAVSLTTHPVGDGRRTAAGEASGTGCDKPAQTGATSVEYAIIAALVVAVVVTIVIVLGRQVCETFADASQELSQAGVTASAPAGVDASCP